MAFGGTNVPTGEKNVIESVSVNGKEIKPVNKKVDIPVPENTDTNTTYTLAKSGNTLTLTGSDGSKSSVTVTDENTTYALTKQGNQIILTGSDGKKTNVEAPNTTYSLEKSGRTITLKGSDGSASSVTETTYEEASEDHSGFMSKEDKEKLNRIPAGGMNAYTGTLSITTASMQQKVLTASMPKLVMLFTDDGGTASSTQAMHFATESGNHQFPGINSVSFTFEDNGVTFSSSGNIYSIKYIVLC